MNPICHSAPRFRSAKHVHNVRNEKSKTLREIDYKLLIEVTLQTRLGGCRLKLSASVASSTHVLLTMTQRRDVLFLFFPLPVFAQILKKKNVTLAVAAVELRRTFERAERLRMARCSRRPRN